MPLMLAGPGSGQTFHAACVDAWLIGKCSIGLFLPTCPLCKAAAIEAPAERAAAASDARAGLPTAPRLTPTSFTSTTAEGAVTVTVAAPEARRQDAEGPSTSARVTRGGRSTASQIDYMY